MNHTTAIQALVVTGRCETGGYSFGRERIALCTKEEKMEIMQLN